MSDELERKRALLTPAMRAALERRLRGGAAPDPRPRPKARELASLASAWKDDAPLALDFAELVAAGAARANDLADHAVGFTSLTPGLDALAVASIARALRDLGFFTTAGERRQIHELTDAVLPTHHKLVRRFAMTLAERGLLRAYDGGFEADLPLPSEPLVGVDLSAADGTEYEHVVGATRAVGAQMADILRGDAHAAETFFAGSMRVVDVAYASTWEAKYCIGVLTSVMRAIAERVPSGRPLRVLEIGAGTGATTRQMLGVLPPDASYVFTDLSAYFLEDARTKLADARVSFDTLNVDEPPPVRGAFDVVVASNVMHCARLIGRSLESVRALLRPGGVILLLETTKDATWHQTTLGLLKGFMSFEDARAAKNLPLLSRAEWEDALSAAQFREATSLPGDDAAGDRVGQHVLLGMT